MLGQHCSTCNIIATHATYENPGYCNMARIALKNRCSRTTQWFNSVTKLMFCMQQERFSHSETTTFLTWHHKSSFGSPLTALVV